MLGLRFCARAFSSCGKRGPLLIAVRGPPTIAASLVAEHRPQKHRLSSCGSRAQLLRGMWDPPRPGLEPVSPALAGRVSTTAPPGKPWGIFFILLDALIIDITARHQEGPSKTFSLLVINLLNEQPSVLCRPLQNLTAGAPHPLATHVPLHPDSSGPSKSTSILTPNCPGALQNAQSCFF